MISKFCLYRRIGVGGIAHCWIWKEKSRILKGTNHRSPRHPSKSSTTSGFVLTKLGFRKLCSGNPDLQIWNFRISRFPNQCFRNPELYAVATVLNGCPSLSLPSASKTFDCFSHRMWRTLTAFPGFTFSALPPFAALSGFASIITVTICNGIFNNWKKMDGAIW